MSPRRLLLSVSLTFLAAGLFWLCAAPTEPADAGLSAVTRGRLVEASGKALAAAAPRRSTVEPAAAEPLRWYRAKVGTAFEFAAEISHQTSLLPHKAAPVIMRQRLTGTLQVLVAKRSKDEILLALHWPESQVTGDAAGEPMSAAVTQQLQADLQRPCMVRMRSDGQTLGYHFAPAMDLENRNWVRTAMSAMRQVVPAAAAEPWQVEETDSSGVASYEYAWTKNARGQRLLRKSRLAGSASKNQETTLALQTEGRGRARYSDQHGWFDRVTWSQRSQGNGSKQQPGIAQKLQVAMRLTTVSVRCPELPDALSWTDLDGRREAELLAERRHAAELQAALQETNAAKILASMQELLRAKGIASPDLLRQHGLLTALLQQDAKAVAQVQAAVHGAGDEDLRGVLVSALGGAGTKACQQALLSCMQSTDARLQQHGIFGLFEVKQPQATVLGRVLAQAQVALQQADGSSSAVLLLGQFARGRKDPASLQPLLGLRELAESNGRLTTWLSALGNARRPEAAIHLYPALKDRRSPVRVAAVEALASSADGAADWSRLRKAVQQEGSEEVRRQMLVSLRRLGGGAARHTSTE